MRRKVTSQQYMEAMIKAAIAMSKEGDDVNVMTMAHAAFEFSAKLLATLEDGIRGDAVAVFAKELPNLVETYRPEAEKLGLNVQEIKRHEASP